MTMKRLLLAFMAVAWLAASGAAGAEEVVPVVSAKSAITSLNAAQVADIFLGKTSRFPDGSQAVPIDLVEDAPERERFYSQFTGKSPAQIKAHWSKIIFTGRGQPPRQVASGREMRRAVAENPNAIGYIEPSLVDSSVRVLASR
jgi:ABC-type phosphate transport system substrate-binding protein